MTPPEIQAAMDAAIAEAFAHKVGERHTDAEMHAAIEILCRFLDSIKRPPEEFTVECAPNVEENSMMVTISAPRDSLLGRMMEETGLAQVAPKPP